MNYASMEKISDNKVVDLLIQEIPGSKGTVFYLKIINLFTDAFLSKDLEPLSRIYKAWFCIFVLRLWRAWLKKSDYSLMNNFITLNAYVCMEINAHGLINIMLKLKREESEHLFLPWLYSSQACEIFFRRLRSIKKEKETRFEPSTGSLRFMVDFILISESLE